MTLKKNEFDEGRLKKTLNLSQKVLPIFHKIYGEYHQKISHHMYRTCLIFTQDDDKEEKLAFLEKTKNCIKITHGPNHNLYRLMQRLYDNSQFFEMTEYIPGDVISSTQAFCHVLLAKNKREYCDYCALPFE